MIIRFLLLLLLVTSCAEKSVCDMTSQELQDYAMKKCDVDIGCRIGLVLKELRKCQ